MGAGGPVPGTMAPSRGAPATSLPELKLPAPCSRRHTPAGIGLPHSAPGCPQLPTTTALAPGFRCVRHRWMGTEIHPKLHSRLYPPGGWEIPLICAKTPCGLVVACNPGASRVWLLEWGGRSRPAPSAPKRAWSCFSLLLCCPPVDI